MTKETFSLEEVQFAGQLVSAMSAQASATANHLDDLRLATIERWKEDYRMLYHSMEKVFERTDSATARDALERFQYTYSLATLSRTETS